MFTSCYCTFNNNKYIIFLCFICNHHKTLLISQIIITNFAYLTIFYPIPFWHFQRPFFVANKRIYHLSKYSIAKRSKHWNKTTQSKHWNMELYWGLFNRGKVDCDSDLNHLYSVIIKQYTRGIFSIVIVDLISRSALIGFILLWAIYYYNRIGIVCYVYSVYNPYSYSDLSMYVFFMLSQYTPAEDNNMLLYFDLQ